MVKAFFPRLSGALNECNTLESMCPVLKPANLAMAMMSGETPPLRPSRCEPRLGSQLPSNPSLQKSAKFSAEGTAQKPTRIATRAFWRRLSSDRGNSDLRSRQKEHWCAWTHNNGVWFEGDTKFSEGPPHSTRKKSKYQTSSPTATNSRLKWNQNKAPICRGTSIGRRTPFSGSRSICSGAHLFPQQVTSLHVAIKSVNMPIQPLKQVLKGVNSPTPKSDPMIFVAPRPLVGSSLARLRLQMRQLAGRGSRKQQRTEPGIRALVREGSLH